MLTDSLVSYRSVALSNETIFYRPVLLSGTYFYAGGRVYSKRPRGKKAFTSSQEGCRKLSLSVVPLLSRLLSFAAMMRGSLTWGWIWMLFRPALLFCP